MGDLSRIGVSLDSELLHQFDSFIAAKGYENRSEAFRDLIRDRLIGSVVVSANALVVGTVTLIYDHHTRTIRRGKRPALAKRNSHRLEVSRIRDVE